MNYSAHDGRTLPGITALLAEIVNQGLSLPPLRGPLNDVPIFSSSKALPGLFDFSSRTGTV